LGIFLYDANTGIQRRFIQVDGQVIDIAFSPDGKTLASGSDDDHPVKLWKVADGTLVRTMEGHTGEVHNVAFSPDGKLLVSASADYTVMLWNVSDGELAHSIYLDHATWIESLAFSPDGSILALASDKGAFLLDANTYQQQVFIAMGWGVQDIAFSPDGKKLVSGSRDKTIRFWNPADGTLERTLTGHTDEVTGVAFSPDGALLASCSRDDTIRLWNTSDGTMARTMEGLSNKETFISFSPDGKRIVSGSHGVIEWWNVSDGTLWRSLKGFTDRLGDFAFNPDGKLFAAGDENGCVLLWDISTGALLRKLENYDGRGTRRVVFSPDGTFLASVNATRNLKLWNVSDGTLVLSLDEDEDSYGGIMDTFFLPDGKQMITVGPSSEGDATTVKQWKIPEGILLRTLRINAFYSGSAFSPDGKQLVVRSTPCENNGCDTLVTLWNISDGTLARTLNVKNQYVAFSPDGTLLAFDTLHSMNVRNALDGTLILTLAGDPDWPSIPEFSPDGTLLVYKGRFYNILDGSMLQPVVPTTGYGAFSPDGRLYAESLHSGISIWGNWRL
jgi:WD40 repeat protein